MEKDKDKKSSLEELKKEYSRLEKKHGLPDFDRLNKDFSVERLAELDTDFLIREIRRLMVDRFSEYLRFVEGLINPVNVPMFVFSVVKLLDSVDRENLNYIYKHLSGIVVSVIELDLDFSEDKEAEFIKENFSGWQNTKESLLKIIRKVNENKDKKSEVNGKSYFG